MPIVKSAIPGCEIYSKYRLHRAGGEVTLCVSEGLYVTQLHKIAVDVDDSLIKLMHKTKRGWTTEETNILYQMEKKCA